MGRAIELVEQVMFYSDGRVERKTAEKEAKSYLRRNIFRINGSISSVGKKLASKCEGKPFV